MIILVNDFRGFVSAGNFTEQTVFHSNLLENECPRDFP